MHCLGNNDKEGEW